MSSLKYWVWLSSLSGLGLKTAGRFLMHFDSPEGIFNASDNDLLNVKIPGNRSKLIPNRKAIEDVDKILKKCVEKQYKIITLNDKEYPERLKNIYDPPLVFYVNGKLPVIDDEPVISIVGTRKCTPYGVNAAKNIAYRLSERGIIVVTGLAKGIDTAASFGALRGGKSTLAVIGSGLDVIYPSANRALYNEISHRGAVISEYPPGTKPLQHHFPMRNRILSGLSLGVLVIEAPKKSGALITAERALEQGRDVYALPGRLVDGLSCGCNRLIRQGAGMIISIDEFADEILAESKRKIIGEIKELSKPEPLSKPKNPKSTNDDVISRLTKEEQQVYSCLDYIPRSLDEISGLCPQITKQVLLKTLITFCVRGIVSQMGAGSYCRSEK